MGHRWLGESIRRSLESLHLEDYLDVCRGWSVRRPDPRFQLVGLREWTLEENSLEESQLAKGKDHRASIYED